MHRPRTRVAVSPYKLAPIIYTVLTGIDPLYKTISRSRSLDNNILNKILGGEEEEEGEANSREESLIASRNYPPPPVPYVLRGEVSPQS